MDIWQNVTWRTNPLGESCKNLRIEGTADMLSAGSISSLIDSLLSDVKIRTVIID